MARGATYSSSVALPESRIPEDPRNELRRGTTGVDFDFDGIRVRAGDVPLLRRSPDGELLQCVRLVLQAEDDRGPAEVALRAGDRKVDGVRLMLDRGQRLVRLFVPEVRAPEHFVLELAPDGGPLVEQPLEVRPQRHWRVFCIHHSHLDVGYTDPQSQVLRNHLAYLDSALDLAAATDAWPETARFRWNVEANWPLQRWLAARPARVREELVERAREGRFEVCALPFTMHLEALSVDELAHQLLFADDLRERHGIPVTTAMQTDVPGAPPGLVGLLADAGIRYLSVAHNYGGRSAPYLTGGQQLVRPFYWRSESGKRVLVWYTDSPHGIAYLEGNLLGLADSYEVALELLPEYLAGLASRPYPYGQACEALGLPADLELTRQPYPYDLLHLRVQGTLADNAAPSIAPAEIVRAWGEEWVYPELVSSTNASFFAAVEERLGAELETYDGEWNDWWADGLGSAARAVGCSRRAQATVRTAQTLHVLADALAGVDPQAGWQADAEQTYESLALFDEHTWTAAHPTGDALSGRESGALQWQTKASLATDAGDRADCLAEAARARIAHLGGTPQGSLASVVVFNPSSSARTDLARVFLPSSRIPTGTTFDLVEVETGRPVPHVRDDESSRNRPRGSTLSFVAHEVPALGYRRYALVDGAAEPAARPDTDERVLENEHYRLELDPAEGCAVSLVDRAPAVELVDSESPFGFGQYVYDRYTSAFRTSLRLPGGVEPDGSASRANLLSARAPARDRLLGARSTAGYGVVTERVSNAVEERISLRLAADGADWLESSFRLVRGVKRLDIQHRLAKVPTAEKESVYFVFPFALAEPDVTYELTGAVGAPGGPHVPGSAAHMRAIRHWVSLEDAGATVAWATLEAPLVELGNVFLPFPPFPDTVEATRPGTVVSWAMNNVWDTNFPAAQGGETVFSYAVSSAAPGADPRALGMRTAATLTRPLVAVLEARAGADRLAASGTFCVLDRDDVEVVALTGSRRGHDLVVLLQSYASDEVELEVAFPDLPVERTSTGTFLERDLAPEARVRIGPGDYVALAVDLAR